MILSRSRIFYFIKIYRFVEWWYFLGLPILGYFYDFSISFSNLLLNLFACFWGLAFAYSINNFFDKNFNYSLLIPLIPLMGIVVSLFLLKNFLHLFVYLILFFVVILYSLPPLELKRIVFASTMFNVISPPLLIIFGIGNLNKNILELIFIFICIFFTAQIYHELADLEKDRKESVVTFVQILGKKNSIIAGLIVLILGCLFSIKNKIFFIGTFTMFICALCNFILYLRNETTNFITFRKRYRTLGLIVGTFWLIYLFVVNFLI